LAFNNYLHVGVVHFPVQEEQERHPKVSGELDCCFIRNSSDGHRNSFNVGETYGDFIPANGGDSPRLSGMGVGLSATDQNAIVIVFPRDPENEALL
jgi:hypothetical protein